MPPDEPPAVPIATPGTPPAPATPPAPPPPPEPVDPENLTLTKDALMKRLDRAARARLNELFGTDDPAKIEAIKAAAKEAETRRQADMTELQKEQAKSAASETARVAAESALATERFNNTVTRACAQLGVKNLDYAGFAVQQAMRGLAQGEELNVHDHLTKLLKQPTMAAALGLEVPVVPMGLTNTPVTPGAPPPAPPAPGGAPPAAKSAMDLTPAEFQARIAALG